MKINDRKSTLRQSRDRESIATSARKPIPRAGVAPKNRIARYYGNDSSELTFDSANPAGSSESEITALGPRRNRSSMAALRRRSGEPRHSEPLSLRRARAERIYSLPLDYLPSREFSRPNADERIMGPMPDSKSLYRKVRAPAELPHYLASLYETPLLTREQEVYLFRKYNYLKYRAAKLREKLNRARPQVRLMDQIERLYEQAVATKNQIVRSNLRLVVSIMKRYANEQDGTFELISDGNMSLLRAVEKFDYTRGFKFSTYATWAIQKNNARQFADDNKRNARFQTGNDEVLAGYAQDDFDPVQAERDQSKLTEQIGRILSRLDRREGQIIKDRFGLQPTAEPKTLKEIGNELGVSKERVRQLEQRAMQNLRELAIQMKLTDPLL